MKKDIQFSANLFGTYFLCPKEGWWCLLTTRYNQRVGKTQCYGRSIKACKIGAKRVAKQLLNSKVA